MAAFEQHSRAEGPCGPQGLKYLLSGQPEKQFANPWFQSLWKCRFLLYSADSALRFQHRPSAPVLTHKHSPDPFPKCRCSFRAYFQKTEEAALLRAKERTPLSHFRAQAGSGLTPGTMKRRLWEQPLTCSFYTWGQKAFLSHRLCTSETSSTWWKTCEEETEVFKAKVMVTDPALEGWPLEGKAMHLWFQPHFFQTRWLNQTA